MLDIRELSCRTLLIMSSIAIALQRQLKLPVFRPRLPVITVPPLAHLTVLDCFVRSSELNMFTKTIRNLF